MDVQCGRINVQGKTMVPDERKGKLRLCKDTDGLTHLQWGSRAADMPFLPEDDLLVFPQEAEMKFIPKPGVFVIKFPDDPSRNMFFWSQQPEGGDDQELTRDINAALNGESPESATRRSDPVAVRARAIRRAQAAAASALTGGSGQEETPATTSSVAETPAAPAKAPAPESQTAADQTPSAVSGVVLRAALGTLGGAGAGAGAGGSGGMDPAAMAAMLAGMQQRGGQPIAARVRGPGLNDVLTPETVGPLLRDESFRERLLEFLPEEHREKENLEELLRTPQFQSQLERFSAALQSGQMDLAQFGLNPGTVPTVAEFLSAIQAKAAKKEEEKKEPES